MITRTAALVAGAGLLALVLVGCAPSGDLFSPSPYFGVHNNNKRYVPKELHETYEVESSAPSAPSVDPWTK